MNDPAGMSKETFEYYEEMAGLKAEIERLRIQRDVYRVIIEAATMESVDMVSAAKMREKFVGIRERESELMAENERLRKVIACAMH